MFLSILGLNRLSLSNLLPQTLLSSFSVVSLEFSTAVAHFSQVLLASLPQHNKLNSFSCELTLFLRAANSPFALHLIFALFIIPTARNHWRLRGQILYLRKSMLAHWAVPLFASEKYCPHFSLHFSLVTEFKDFILALARLAQFAKCFSPGFISL